MTKFNTNGWINLKIRQIHNIYEIKIDNKIVHRVVTFKPKKWRNVDLIIGNTYGTGKVLDIGKYRNFEINTCSECKFIWFEIPYLVNLYSS